MYREFDKATMHTTEQDSAKWPDGFDRRQGHHDDIELLTEQFLRSGGKIEKILRSSGDVELPDDHFEIECEEEEDRGFNGVPMFNDIDKLAEYDIEVAEGLGFYGLMED